MWIDGAIARIDLTLEEAQLARQQFYEIHQIVEPEARRRWLSQMGMTETQLETATVRALRIEKFKWSFWGSKVEGYFLDRKTQLDQVVYSLIRTHDPEIAQELYFRIQDEEQSFEELAEQYSEGEEAQTGGIIGPVALSQPHPAIAQKLLHSQPGQVIPPLQFGEWFVISRLERLISSQLNASMRQQMLDELFETWIDQQLDSPCSPAEIAAMLGDQS